MGFFSGDNDQNYRDVFANARGADQRFGRLGQQLGGDMEAIRRRANGQGLLSPELLRAGLEQNLGAQRSLAAGAAPQNQAMAGLNASRNAMNLGSGMAGQATQAAMQEQQAAQDALIRAQLERQRMEQQAAMGNRQMALDSRPSSWWDRFGGAVKGGAQLASSI